MYTARYTIRSIVDASTIFYSTVDGKVAAQRHLVCTPSTFSQVAKNGAKLVEWHLTDLEYPVCAVAKLQLYEEAFDSFYGEDNGSVWAILNPTVLPPMRESALQS